MSDTIIMYENGKAVGGESHPTNADEITFNNEDTDLVSEEVESAIKEVNAKFDKGSVSVTANGNKTYATLLSELVALADMTKINKNSIILDGANIFHTEIINAASNAFGFTKATVSTSASYISRIILSATPSYGTATTTYATNATAYSNDGISVPANGHKITLEY